MNLQSERIADACCQLGLYALPENWPRIAEKHLAQEGSYADFIEKLLIEEINAKMQRTKAILLQFAGLPHIGIFLNDIIRSQPVG
ncbi:ATP-binding protein [Providencia rettgeri]|uniref:ATP-binding protein n=1 Tax=Providencia TaxID=586 RepID=UPI0022749095|nr:MULTISPECIES: ATP-binding protein [unclassified Providencia]MDB9565499.1 ATP-binding protein [Providencia rettgeri]WOB91784.1 ATP-binding protein [Providencia sp. PROV175]